MLPAFFKNHFWIVLLGLIANHATYGHPTIGKKSLFRNHFHLASAAISTALSALPQTNPQKKELQKGWHALSLLIHAGIGLDKYLSGKKAIASTQLTHELKKRFLDPAIAEDMKEYLQRIELVECFAQTAAEKAKITVRNVAFLDQAPPFALYTVGGGKNTLILLSPHWIVDDEAMFEHLEPALAHEMAHAKFEHNNLDVLVNFISSAFFDIAALCKDFSRKSYAAQLAVHAFLKKQTTTAIKRCCEFTADAYAAQWTSCEQTTRMLQFIKQKHEEMYQEPKKSVVQFLIDSTSTHPEMARRIAYIQKPNVTKRHTFTNPFCYAWW